MQSFQLFFQKKFQPGKMTADNGRVYEFADFRLIPHEGLLLRNGEPVKLSIKAFSTLVHLVERHGHLVQKSELIESVWADVFVEEAVLSKCVWSIRNALGEDPKSAKFIQTIPRRGYRFVFPVTVVTDSSGAFRLVELNGLVEGETDFPEEQKPATNGAGGGVSISTNGAAATVPAADPVNELREVLPGKRSSSLFHRWKSLAGLAGIVVVAALAGYYGFIRETSARSPRAIAILPISPLNHPDRGYQLGIAGSLIEQINSVEGIMVRPLHAVTGYAETPKDPIAAGREQEADYVLASNYQIADGKIKVTSELYNVRTGALESSFRSVRPVADVFAAQDAIAADLGSQVMGFFGASARGPAKQRGTENEEAYLAYVQGMYLLDRLPAKETYRARESLERAVGLDPNYARAWAGKALAHSYEHRRDSEHLHAAREAVDKALSIDPNESLAYTALCDLLLYHEWNYSASSAACRRAVELDPTSSFARSEYAVVLTSLGQFDEAFDQLKKAMQVDPTSFRVLAFYANTLFMARRYEEAEAQYRGLIDLKRDRAATYSWLVRVAEVQGKEAEAFEWTVELMAAEEKGDEAIQRYKGAYQNSGYQGALPERINLGIMPIHAYVQLGDKDKAFEKLEASYVRRSYYLAVWGIVDPLYDPLRDDPRWTDLVRRVKAGGN